MAKENLSEGGKSAGRGRPQQPLAKLPKAIDTRKECAKSLLAKLPNLKAIDTRKECATAAES